MADFETDTIKIVITGEDKGSKKAIQSQIDQLKKLDKAIERLNQAAKTINGAHVTSYFKMLDKAFKTMDVRVSAKAIAAMSKIASMGNMIKKADADNYKKVAEGIRDILKSTEGLDKVDAGKLASLATLAQAGRAATAKAVSQATKGFGLRMPKDSDLGESMKTISKGGGTAGSVPEATKEVEDNTQAVEENAQQVMKASTFWRVYVNAMNGTGTVLKKMGGILKSAASHMLSFTRAAMSNMPVIRGFRAIGNAAKSMSEKLHRGFSDIMRIVKYRMIRSMIKEITQGISEGIKNAYQYAKIKGNQFAASMDTIATASQYAKNSLGALAMPLINLVAPAIDYVVDKFVSLINIINEAIATLTGQSTWTKAIKTAKTWGDATDDAAGKAKKAMDAYKNTILGIDEINPLNGVNDSGTGGGGGGGDATDYGTMFETMEVGTSEWSETLGKFFDPLKKAWDNKGKAVTDSFDTALTNIKDLISTVTSTFAKVFGEVDKDGKTPVQLIAESILTTVSNLASSIGNVAANLKTAWEENGGETIVTNLKDMMVIIAGAASTITTKIKSWTEKLDFSSLMTGVADLTTAFKKFTKVKWTILEDAWDYVIEPLATWAVEDAIPTVLSGFATAISDIADVFDENWDSLKPKLTKLVKSFETLAGIVWDTLEDAWKNIVKPILEYTVSTILPDTIDALGEALETLGLVLETAWPVIKPVLKFFLGLAATAFDTAVTTIGNLCGAINGLASGDLETAKTNLDELYNTLFKLTSSMPGGETIQVALEVAYEFGDAFGSDPVGSMEELYENIWSVLANMPGTGFFMRTIDVTLSLTSTADELIKKVFAPSKLDVAVELVKTWSTVYAWVNQFTGGAVQKLVSLAKDKWTTIWQFLKDNFGAPFQALVELAKDGWDTVFGWMNKKENSGGEVQKGVTPKKGGTGTWTLESWLTGKNQSGGEVQKGVTPKKGGTGKWTLESWLTGKDQSGGEVQKGVTPKKGGSGTWTLESWFGKKAQSGDTAEKAVKPIWGAKKFDNVLSWLTGDDKRWGGDAAKNVGLSKGWSGTVEDWVESTNPDRWGDKVYKPIYLTKKPKSEGGWDTVRDWVESKMGDGTVEVPIDLIIHDIGINTPGYASGGMVASGQLFVARENGLPEMVGSFGNQTGVANNDQIIEGITQGVAAGQAGQNRLLQEQNALLRAILSKESGSSDVVRALNATNARVGHALV